MADNHPKHDHATLKFPDNFLWGAATSAHQVEGDNINSDWWDWEKNQKLKTGSGNITPSSGKACDQYNLYEQDFKLIKELGHNTHRLSIEWSRIEPVEGIFNQDAIDHYIEVLKSIKEKGIVVMLTLNHFTLPLWLSKKGGWENFKSPDYFAKFVQKIVPDIKDYVDLWITINEPDILAYEGYVTSKFPPKKKNKLLALKAFWNLSQAHKKAYFIIHQIEPKAKVGFTNNVTSFSTYHQHSILENGIKIIYEYINNHLLYLLTGKTIDFLGINYYNHQYISIFGKKRLPQIASITETKKEISDMGWEVRPEGMFDILVDFSSYKLPIYITENGIATTNDDRRVRYLISYLKDIYHAIQTGLNIKGYYYWSLLDNFEWSDGFDPKFGLIEVDFKTQKRTPRPSSRVYKEIIKNNGIPHPLLKLLGHGIKVEEVIEDTAH